MKYLTADEIKAITDAVLREVSAYSQWDEIKDQTLAGLCSANQDALIDDLFERHPDDAPHEAGMISHVRIYDRLLGTSRAAELDKR